MRFGARIRLLTALALLCLIIAVQGASGARADQQRAPVTKSTKPAATQDATAEATVSEVATDDSGDVSIDGITPTATRGSARPTATKPGKATPAATETPDTSTALTLEDGGSVDGPFDDQNILYRIEYTGTKDAQVVFTLQSKGLTVNMAILSPKNTTFDDGLSLEVLSAASGKSAHLPLTLPADGLYVIVVTPSNSGKGTFTLSVAPAESTDTTVDTIDINGVAATVISNLQKTGLVPTGGKQVLTLPTSFGTTSDPGFSYLTIGRGLSVQDLVLNFQVGWNSAGATSGCGVIFRAVDDNNFSVVLLTNDGQAVLLQRQSNKNILDYEKASKLFKPGSFSTVTLIAVQDKLILYINGKLETTQKSVKAKGGFTIEVYNAKANKTVTDCRYRNLWIWSFDQ